MKTHNPPPSETELTHFVDYLIKEHVAKSADETDQNGAPVASISAADKFNWAKQSGADVEFVDKRLHELCEEAPMGDKPTAVPRYRMKKEAD